MKAGLTTSVILHAAVLAFGLFSLSAPAALEVADTESLPVDIVPLSELTQIQQGDKKADLNDKPAPTPTKRPDIVADAQKVGDNSVDTEKPPTPEAKPTPVEEAAAPPPAPEPKEQIKTEDVPKPKEEPKPVPTTEVAPVPQPREEVKPEPVKEFDADAISALLNKQKPSGGGAKRSTQQASLGGERTTGGATLSQNEMDALRQKLGGCWSIPAGVDDAATLKVSVRFQLDRSGMLQGRPQVVAGGAASGPARTAAESAVRAVQKCAPFNLPADKYDTWAEVVVNFDPSDMF